MKKQLEIRKKQPTWKFPDFDEKVLSKKKHEYCVCVFVINEGKRVRTQLGKMRQLAESVDIVIADGGSTDGSLDEPYLKKQKVRALLTKRGPGKLSAQMRMAFAWALGEGYKGVVVVDGNNKDSVERIPNFVALLEQGYDHIQGSRFIPGGKAVNTPLSREIGLHVLHAPLISIAAGKRHTDTTNGFRGYSAKLLTDKEINIFRDAFQTYELHYYLAIESSRRKQYKTIETPVVRTYPKGKVPTKISPIKGNIHILKVLCLSALGAYKPNSWFRLRATLKYLAAHWWIVLLATALLLAAFCAAVAYPGYMSLDSLRQLQQALGFQPYSDWHPPLMAFLWSIGIQLTGKVSSLLIFQTALLWAALFGLALYIYQQTSRKLLSFLPLALGLTPFVLSISGVLWKDVQMAVALLLAVVLSMWLPKTSRNVKLFFGIVIVLSLAYALLLRYNAVLAVLPILYYAVRQFTNRKAFIAAAFIGFFIVVAAITSIVGSTLRVQSSNPTSTVMLDDIVHTMSVSDIKETGAPLELQDSLVAIKSACDAKEVSMHSYHFCSTGEQRQVIQYKYLPELKEIWLRMLTGHLPQYLQYRLTTMGIFMTTPAGYEYIQNSYVIKNELGVVTRHQGLSSAVTNYVEYFARDFGILFRPYFWLLLSIAILIMVRKTVAKNARLISCLVFSAILYIVGYFPVVIAGDYRYIYWSVLACSVALLLLLADRAVRRAKQ